MHASPGLPQSVSRAVFESRRFQNMYSYLRNLDLRHEALAQIFEHDAITGGKEGQDVTNEVLLVRT